MGEVEVERGENKVPGCWVYVVSMMQETRIIPLPGNMAAVSPGGPEILAILIHTEAYGKERFMHFLKASVIKSDKLGMDEAIRLLCQDYSFWKADGMFTMRLG